MEQTAKYKTETQAFVGRCKELFHMFIEGKITYEEMQKELEKMKEKPLFKLASGEKL